jgi:hypothetical protein
VERTARARPQRRTQLPQKKRSSETHASTTDRDARLARKSNGEGAGKHLKSAGDPKS